ncbi:helix-turn-helix domain-containing protein [Phenylobacterium sp.]|uniref:helix-turn-helix transcriptional regulator n=1 Tax=Phenylobacterium sp. TaxID=1871053 RepID=UPI0030F40BEA
MRFNNLLSDDAVTEEIGCRVAAVRLQRQMTQAQLAAAAGVSKRTVERLEGGAPTQLGNLIRCLRALDKLEDLERFLPETPTSPIALLKAGRAQRSRVRASKGGATSGAIASPTVEAPVRPGWVWGDQT